MFPFFFWFLFSVIVTYMLNVVLVSRFGLGHLVSCDGSHTGWPFTFPSVGPWVESVGVTTYMRSWCLVDMVDEARAGCLSFLVLLAYGFGVLIGTSFVGV